MTQSRIVLHFVILVASTSHHPVIRHKLELGTRSTLEKAISKFKAKFYEEGVHPMLTPMKN